MSAQGLHDADEGDLRQGVSRAGHDVLDLAAGFAAIGTGRTAAGIAGTLADAQRAAAAALRADPACGMGARRRAKAIEAAALLIHAVELMDAQP